MSLRHRKQVTMTDGSQTSKVQASDWGSTSTNYTTAPTHVFSGGALGSLLYRDTGSIDGMSWLPSAQGVLAASGAGAVPAFTMTPTLTSLTLASALTPANGGTGLASYTIGDLLYASGATTLSKLADVAAGSVLASGGVAGAPAWSATPTLTSIRVGNAGLRALDSDASHYLTFTPGSNLSADHTLTFTTGDADRTVTLSGNPTLADWFDQSVKSGTTPTFTGTNFTGIPIAGIAGLGSGVATWLATPSSANLAAAVTGETGTGALVFADSPTLTTVATLTRNSLGATSTDGLVLQNTTAAAAGAQQRSPRLRLTGQGWKTDTTAASQTVDWIIDVLPTQGAANPGATLVFANQLNGGGYNTRLSMTEGGILQTTATLSGNGANAIDNFLAAELANSASAFWGINGRWRLSAPAANQMVIASASIGVGLDFGTDAILKLRNRAISGGAALNFIEQTAPSAPSANEVVLYAQDNGAGKTQLMALFNSGAAQQVAIQP